MIILKILLYVFGAIVTIWIGVSMALVAVLPKTKKGDNHSFQQGIIPLSKRIALSLVWPFIILPRRKHHG